MAEEKPKEFTLAYTVKSVKPFRGSDGKMLTEAHCSISAVDRDGVAYHYPSHNSMVICPLTSAAGALIVGAVLEVNFKVKSLPKLNDKQKKKMEAQKAVAKERTEAILDSLLGSKDNDDKVVSSGIIPSIEERRKIVADADKDIPKLKKAIENAKNDAEKEKASDKLYDIEEGAKAATKQLAYLDNQKKKQEEKLSLLNPQHPYFGREKK